MDTEGRRPPLIFPLYSWVPSDLQAPQGPTAAQPQELLFSLPSHLPQPLAPLMPPLSSWPLTPQHCPPAPPNPLLGLQPSSPSPPSRPQVLPRPPNPSSVSPIPLAPHTLQARDPLALPAPLALLNCPHESLVPLALPRLLPSTWAPPAHLLPKSVVLQAPQRDLMTLQCPHGPMKVLISTPLCEMGGSGAPQRAFCGPCLRGRAWGSWGAH